MEETRRRTEKNKVLSEIKIINKYISTNQATIDRLRNSTTDLVFNTVQSQKLIAKNEEHAASLETLGQRLVDLEDGTLDTALEQQVTATKQEIDRKSLVTQKRKQSVKIPQVQFKPKEQYHRPQSQRDTYNKPKTDGQYEHFQKACGSVPEFMLKKLRVMPNNKGYIWHGVYCFGELPAERGQPTLIFDRQRDGTMIIREWTPRECKVWLKPENKPKILQSCKPNLWYNKM
jgi:hypothetical protein